MIPLNIAPSGRREMRMPAAKTSKSPATKSRRRIAKDFPAAYAALKNLLAPYEKELQVMPGEPGRYWLETRCAAYKGKPLFFAGVSLNKNYVSYYFMPIYVRPELGKNLSPELKKRQQGKCCFNFVAPDPVLFRELAELARAGFACYRDKRFLSAMEEKRSAGSK
jgi:hypothetical protein